MDYPWNTWTRENNAVAARVPRGRSTPASRLQEATREYENCTIRLGRHVAVDDRTLLVDMRDGAYRTGPTSEMDIASAYVAAAPEQDACSPVVLAAYGAGRALERATQLARFERYYNAEEFMREVLVPQGFA